ncbi:hypothetical protein E2C01_000184 [Portunus trituberculatus]|uniref:Uncharacterized protein n=1 Tax=Portunus trituberculatus TaxID=210409 RepID=A0A5B7CEJ1_PORTR|nr:hypothetical protein [Portunus trituberculatus]
MNVCENIDHNTQDTQGHLRSLLSHRTAANTSSSSQHPPSSTHTTTSPRHHLPTPPPEPLPAPDTVRGHQTFTANN